MTFRIDDITETEGDGSGLFGPVVVFVVAVIGIMVVLVFVGCEFNLTQPHDQNVIIGQPTPSPAPTSTPIIGLPTGAPCSDNLQCTSKACIAGFCK